MPVLAKHSATRDACYDGHTSKTYEHFFGDEHRSDAALSIMRRVIPPT
jgi:hypothetical protein